MTPRRVTVRALPAALLLVGLAAGCAPPPATPAVAAPDPAPATTPTSAAPPTAAPTRAPVPLPAIRPAPVTTAAPASPSPAPATAASAPARPDWLGTRLLDAGPDGIVPAQPTPPELVDRRLPAPDSQPEAPGEDFSATVAAVGDDVLARSTWNADCPVSRDALRYVTVTFWGFDGRHHAGELLVHASAADDVVAVFGSLHAVRFPIEEMRVVAPAELDAPPTGDGNNTTSFVCRAARGTTRWSEHAYGLAVDINPFHNPYQRGERVLPELATAYLDRDHQRPGMVAAGDVVTTAFAEIGWGWGGAWQSLDDWMHFSRSGR